MNLASVVFPNFGSGKISRLATTLLLGMTAPFSSGSPGTFTLVTVRPYSVVVYEPTFNSISAIQAIARDKLKNATLIFNCKSNFDKDIFCSVISEIKT